MPEGDTIFRAARTLQMALGAQLVTGFQTVLPHLARIDHDTPLAGRTVDSVVSEGKWLVMRFSGGLILLSHMLMSGSWHIYRPGERWKRRQMDMRIVVETAKMISVAFTVPVAEFHNEATLAERLKSLGPRVLAVDFDCAAAVANLESRPDLPVADALLSQSLLAGVGNVIKSEVCYTAGVNPFRLVSTLHRTESERLVTEAQRLLRANIGGGFRNTTGRINPGQRSWVYGRGGEPCRRCGTAIESRKQAPSARVTYWCPFCQPSV